MPEQDKNLVQTLKEKAESVQAVVSFIRDEEAAFRYAVDITIEQGGKSIAAPGIAEDKLEHLRTICGDKGIELLPPPLRNHCEKIHTALTSVDWGIAETGTLALNSTSEETRIATMLSETHVAILPSSRIVPESMALEGEISAMQQSPPRYFAFITGPSRTADIERVLAIGVHGPQDLHILIMEEDK